MTRPRLQGAMLASLLAAAFGITTVAMGANAVDVHSPTPGPSGPEASPTGVEIAWDYGPGTYDFPEPTSGLAELGSYRSTLTVSFTGTDQGQASEWSNGYEMVVRDPAARQLTVTAAEPAYRAEVDGVAYQQPSGAGCTAGAIYAPDGLGTRWEPARFLLGVVGAVEAGTETVNGTAAIRYTFDQRAFGPLPPSDSRGDLWVASDGAYIVRYLLTTVGTADYFGEGSEGTLTLEYNVTDVNTPLAIELPDACSRNAIDAPLMPDAVDVARVPGLVSYTTASTPKVVAAFYQQQLPALGWQLTADPTVSRKATFLKFTRDAEQISILIEPGKGGTSVQLIGAAVQH